MNGKNDSAPPEVIRTGRQRKSMDYPSPRATIDYTIVFPGESLIIHTSRFNLILPYFTIYLKFGNENPSKR